MYTIDYNKADFSDKLSEKMLKSGKVGRAVPIQVAKDMVKLVPDDWFEPKKDELLSSGVVYIYNPRVKELEEMKFDVVCGNPPYNPNNRHNDFMDLGADITSKYMLMIHPVGNLLRKYASNLTDIVYYPDEGDIFTIKKPGGLVYYLYDKVSISGSCRVTTKSMLANCLNSSSIYKDLSDASTLLCIALSILDKLGNYNSLNVDSVNALDYYVISSNMVAYCNSRQCPHSEKTDKPHGFFSTNGDSNVLPKLFDNVSENTDSGVGKIIFSSNIILEIKSFESYLETKFVKFLVLCGLRHTAVYDDFTFRFVPKPEVFDHIFTDEELYSKYGLSKEEINIIESVIRERKQ